MLLESFLKFNFKQFSHGMSVTNVNCIKATGITIMVTMVVAKGSYFNMVDTFYRYTMGKLFKISF